VAVHLRRHERRQIVLRHGRSLRWLGRELGFLGFGGGGARGEEKNTGSGGRVGLGLGMRSRFCGLRLEENVLWIR
jgi:hypothetical protein